MIRNSRRRILYVSLNDGSDTRINKEIVSLSSHFEVHFLGIGEDNEKCFLREYCASCTIIKGRIRSALGIGGYYVAFIKTIFTRKMDFIHVVNEQNYLLLLPFLFWNDYVTIDVFDSMFLRKDKGKLLKMVQWFVYWRARRIVLTDENRRSLMPSEFDRKYVILPNYPYKYARRGTKKVITRYGKTHIFYFGSLMESRGTKVLLDLLENHPSRFVVTMAGWLYDAASRDLSQRKGVHFVGVVEQREALRLAESADYLLCLYEPTNMNTINASPNKIWDAIQVRTPLIINSEIAVSNFVIDKGLGVVIPSFYDYNIDLLAEELERKRGTFRFSSELSSCVWEGIEDLLIEIYEE